MTLLPSSLYGKKCYGIRLWVPIDRRISPLYCCYKCNAIAGGCLLLFRLSLLTPWRVALLPCTNMYSVKATCYWEVMWPRPHPLVQWIWSQHCERIALVWRTHCVPTPPARGQLPWQQDTWFSLVWLLQRFFSTSPETILRWAVCVCVCVCVGGGGESVCVLGVGRYVYGVGNTEIWDSHFLLLWQQHNFVSLLTPGADVGYISNCK